MIKEVNREDIELIRELEESFKDYFKSKGIEEDFDKNIFSKYFIYLEKCNIIGFVNYYDLYDRFEIAYIEVKTEFRNKKIGSKLMENVIDIAQNKKVDNITLEVNINNENAIKLYNKYNFKVVAIRPRYYNGIDGYLMERKMI